MKLVKIAVWAVCAVLGVGVYVAAKLDFVRRFDPNNVAEYLAGHWPYWAALVVVAMIASVATRVGSGGG